jgi:hypothetical protein
MRVVLWVYVYVLSVVSDYVDSRLTKHLRVENEFNEIHRRKLIQADSIDAVSGTYIVHFKNETTDEEVKQKAKELAAQTGGKILWIYKEIFKGFAISGLKSENQISTILGHDDIEVMDQVRRLEKESSDAQYELLFNINSLQRRMVA